MTDYADLDDHPLVPIIVALLQRAGEPFKATFTKPDLNDLKNVRVEVTYAGEGSDSERMTLRVVPTETPIGDA